MIDPAQRSAPALSIDLIDRDYLEITATGEFSASFRTAISNRLDQLVSGGPIRLRIDFTKASTVDSSIAELMDRTGAALTHIGGVLEVVGAERWLHPSSPLHPYRVI